MDTIIALLNTKNQIKKKSSNKITADKLDYFEKIVSNNQAMTDEDACMEIYGHKIKSATFKSLKYRLEEKLMSEIFNLSSDEINLKSRTNAKLVVSKYYTIAMVLLKNQQRKAAVTLLEKGLRISVQFSYTDLSLMILKPLINHFGFVDVDNKKMKELIKLNDELKDIYMAEDYVQMCNAIISNLYLSNKGSFNNNQLKEFENMVLEMRKLKDKYPSNTIVTYTFDLTFFYYSIVGEHKKCLEIAKESLDVNQSTKNNDVFGIFTSKMNIATSYFQLGQFEEANKWCEEAITMSTYGNRSRLNVYSLYYLSLVGNKEYDKVFEITNIVLEYKILSKLPILQEHWKIREAYMHFLIRMGKIGITEDQKKTLRPFVLTKFLNSVPFYSKDKSGQNITILILQILFLILDRKYGQVIDRVDALTQYTYRYIRKDDSFRSNCFIKMLLLCVKADFHPVRTQNFTNELRKKLVSAPFVTNEMSAQVEIIPYDFLWELVLELLQKNK